MKGQSVIKDKEDVNDGSIKQPLAINKSRNFENQDREIFTSLFVGFIRFIHFCYGIFWRQQRQIAMEEMRRGEEFFLTVEDDEIKIEENIKEEKDKFTEEMDIDTDFKDFSETCKEDTNDKNEIPKDEQKNSGLNLVGKKDTFDIDANDQVTTNELSKEEIGDCSRAKKTRKTKQGKRKRTTNIYLLKKCPHCEKLFNDSLKLKYHVYTHTGEKPFLCDVCQQRFSHPSPFRRHKLRHGENTIACHHCPKMFSAMRLLKIHLKCVDQHQSFTCDICGNVFAQKYNLTQHRWTHTGETPYSCNQCESKFNKSYKLKAHINTIHLKAPKQIYTCEFCAKEYKKKSGLKEHARTHSGEPEIECENCNQTFNTQTAYRNHMKIHNKLYECKQCGKCFGSGRNLERHEKMHNGIKDFQCELCVKSYSSMISMQKHMEIKHKVNLGKQLTFSCNQCNRAYTRDDYLQRHIGKGKCFEIRK